MQNLKHRTGNIGKTVNRRRIYISRIKRKVLTHVWINRGAILLLVVALIFLFSKGVLAMIARTNADYYFKLARNFVITPGNDIRTINNRTNILILGRSGGDHAGPDLTDTIMFVSIAKSTVSQKASIDLISIPRDIWVTEMRTKINSVYYWGNKKKEGGGLALARSEVEKVVGQPVSYGLVIDFDGFKKIIDTLGGVDVVVDRTFTDNKYPIAGREDDECGGDPEYKCRYETVTFESGLVHMDGEKALKFVRSRNAEGDEGTDFARAARQEKVLQAIKKKLLTTEVLLSPAKIKSLTKIVSEYIETDISPETAAIMARRILQSRNSITSHVIPEDLLDRPDYSSEYDNLYVFIPKGGNWGEIHRWVADVLNNSY
jgi:LCP family protein required for cell wall assembly